MMSSSVSRVGDVVIITQVLPRGQPSFPLTPSAANDPPSSIQQAPPPPCSPTQSTQVDDMSATFLRGCPVSLGVVQIFLGVLFLLFTLTFALSPLLLVNAPFCAAIVFVVSGSVVVVTGRRISLKQVWASLISNAVSMAVSVVGVAYSSWLLAELHLSEMICDDIISDADKHECVINLWLLDSVVTGLLSVVLSLLLLQFCVSTTVTVFSGKSIRCQRRRYGDLSDDDHCDDRQVIVSENHDGVRGNSP